MVGVKGRSGGATRGPLLNNGSGRDLSERRAASLTTAWIRGDTARLPSASPSNRGRSSWREVSRCESVRATWKPPRPTTQRLLGESERSSAHGDAGCALPFLGTAREGRSCGGHGFFDGLRDSAALGLPEQAATHSEMSPAELPGFEWGGEHFQPILATFGGESVAVFLCPLDGQSIGSGRDVLCHADTVNASVYVVKGLERTIFVHSGRAALGLAEKAA